jgi:hypothetical protein
MVLLLEWSSGRIEKPKQPSRQNHRSMNLVDIARCSCFHSQPKYKCKKSKCKVMIFF